MPEFDAGAAGGEPPVDLALVGVRRAGPGGELLVEDLEFGDAPAEALLGRQDSSISAMLSQDPCLGVWWISNLPASA